MREKRPASGVRRPASLPILLAALLVTGCGQDRARIGGQSTTPPDSGLRTPDSGHPAAETLPAPNTAAALADEVLKKHGQAAAVTSDLLVRVKAPNSDAILFQISLWCPADGRIRLEISKLDIAFIQALIQPNGDFVAVMVRSQEVVHGNLRDITVFDQDGKPSGPPFLAYLTLLVQEAKIGPLSPRGPFASPDGKTLRTTDPVSGLACELAINPDGTAVNKRLFDPPAQGQAQGREALRLDYGRYKRFEELNRPGRINLVVPGDATEYSVGLRTLDAVPSVDAARMKLEPSQAAKPIGMEEFLKRLRE